MAYLDDHPPARAQFRCPRRMAPSGVVVAHTAENTADTVGPDAGAEAVASFIAHRTDQAGSYHDLVDSDSTVHLVRYECEAFHVAVFSMNQHSYGVSAACEADKWLQKSAAWREATVHNMAAAARNYANWLWLKRRIVIPARHITVEQARALVPGFIGHGELDPMRRHDPGAAFPWATFLSIYHDLGGGDPRQPIPPQHTPLPEGVTVPVSLRVLQAGMHGGDVKSLQALLVDKAGQGGTLDPGAIRSSHAGVDGKFGAHTDDAVRNVQRYFGLQADGVVGPKTWSTLFL